MALKKITTVDAAESVSSSANLYVEDSGAFKRITPAQAKGLLGVDELKSAVDGIALTENIWSYGTIAENKQINPNSGNLANDTNYDTTDYIPVKPGDIIYGYGLRFACYDAEKVFTGNTAVLSGLSTKLLNDTKYYVIPSGVSYFRISSAHDSHYTYRVNLYENHLDMKIDAAMSNCDIYSINLWSYGTILKNRAVTSSGGTTSNADYDTTDYIPVSEGDIIYGHGARFAGYDANKTFNNVTAVLSTQPTALSNGMHYYIIPADTSYIRICSPHDYLYTYLANPFEVWLKDLIESAPTPKRKLYTLGDSITRGMYAEIGTSSSSGPTQYGYPYYIANENNYELVNLGNSGSGWANKGSAETIDDTSVNRNAKDVVDSESFADADIITLAYGVNDWKGATQDVQLGSMASTSGDGTVIGNMKYCIETLTTKKPTAQIIVLLPLNTNRQWSGMATMTVEDNWAFGYAYRYGKTLEDYRSAIRECAEYYNVKVVDLEEVCPINRLNLRSVCGDGLHPTKAFHKQMGQALAPLIH